MAARGIKVNGKRLRKLRQARLLSQAELARRGGTTTATANRIENGRVASRETVENYARVLGVEPEWLLAEPFVDVIAEESNGDREAVAVGAGKAPIDLSDSSGIAYMDRVEIGDGVEELQDDVEQYFDFLPKHVVDPDAWTVEGFERNLGWGLAALARHDREQGAEAITQVIQRLREMMEKQ